MAKIDQLASTQFIPTPRSKENGAETLQATISPIVLGLIHEKHQKPDLKNPHFVKFDQPVFLNGKTYYTCGDRLLWDPEHNHFFRLAA